jgi:MFS family permease
MAEDTGLRRDLLAHIDARRASVQAFLREHRPRIRRRATITIVLSSLAAVFTAGPAFGGEPFAQTVQGIFGLQSDSTVWRLLCFLALLVSVSAAVLTNLSKSQDDVARLSGAEAANAELEGLSGLLQFGHLAVEDGVKLYQQYTAKIPFVEDQPVGAPGFTGPAVQGPGYYAPPPQGPASYGPPPQGPASYAPPPPGRYPPPPPHE